MIAKLRAALKSKIFLAGCVVFLLSAILRLESVHTAPVHPDELLWLFRSHEVLERLDHMPGEATTHLTHPGIFPALSMAFSQRVAQDYAIARDPATAESTFRRIRLDAARVPLALLCSLTAPLIFFGFVRLLGFFPAFLGALIFALDPREIGIAQIAHLDAALALLMTASTVFYVRAVERGSIPAKMIAAIFWGLALATKLTAATLIAGFLAYRVVRLVTPRTDIRPVEKGIVSWSDVWAVVVAHAALAGVYTRLWRHNGFYLKVKKIYTKKAVWLWLGGTYLREHLLSAGVLIGGLFALGRIQMKKGGRVAYHLAMFSFLAGTLLALLGLFPEIFENFARYWSWATGLSKLKHNSYGQWLPPPPLGYIGFFISRVPTLTILGVVLGIWGLLCAALRRRFSLAESTMLALVALGLITIAPLQLSSKQAWRYAAPIVPYLSLLAGFGFWMVLEKLPVKVRSLLIVALVGTQLCFTLSWRNAYRIFYNQGTGSLSGAMAREELIEFIGIEGVVKYLIEHSHPVHVENVHVGGDASLINFVSRRVTRGEPITLRFGYFGTQKADFLIRFPSHPALTAEAHWDETLATVPVYEFKYRGTTLVQLFAIRPQTFEETYHMPAHRSGKETGEVVELNGARYAFADATRHKPGRILIWDAFRIQPGTYEFGLRLLGIPATDRPVAEDSGGALRVELTSSCKYTVSIEAVRSLKAGQENDLKFECTFPSEIRAAPSVYWRGVESVMLADLTIQAKS